MSSTQVDLSSDNIQQVRADLEKLKEDEAQVEQRKKDLMEAVKSKIAELQQILTRFGAADVPAPVSQVTKRPSIADYARMELEAAGQEMETSALRQALVSNRGIPPNRLKNLSQLLYKASVVFYKKDHKVGLVAWKHQRPAKKQEVRKRYRMSPENRQAASERMKAYWAKRRQTGAKKRRAR